MSPSDPTPDLTGRCALVTGANRGIGLASAIEFARAGARVVLACRDAARADAATTAVRRIAGDPAAEFLTVDLSSQASIRQLAACFRERHGRLDILMNNAATVSEDRRTTADGRELTFAVNHLAYYLLTRLLLDRLLTAGDAVVLNVAATNHRGATERLEDLDSVERYEMREAYQRSKLANVSFTLELSRRLAATRVRVNSFCPNVVATDLLMRFRRVPSAEWAARLAMEKPPRTAALVALSLATTPGTGRYLEEGMDVLPSPEARDRAYGRWLWRRCSELTGLDP